jgi:hemin uptake protein HemP
MRYSKKQVNELSATHPPGEVTDNISEDLPVVIEAGQIFGDKREVGIRFEGQMYRLRITRNGKLILNK